MTPERYKELTGSPEAKLTPDEMAAGWRFCMCEWDGLLVQAGDPESKFCGCFYNSEGQLKEPT